MKKMTMLALGAGLLLVAVGTVAAPRSIDPSGVDPSGVDPSGVDPSMGQSAALRVPSAPLESPGFDEDCYEWQYPTKDVCGVLSGTSECKVEPTINSAADPDKREQCQPTKGRLCICD